jgi:ribonuclease P protein component
VKESRQHKFANFLITSYLCALFYSSKTLFTFSKNEKLCKRDHIQQLFSAPDSHTIYPLKLLYTPIHTLQAPYQLLISVPKRTFKKAVHRNRLKRLIREAYRLQKHHLPHPTTPYALAIIYIGKELTTYQHIYHTLTQLIEKLNPNIKNDKI